MLAELIDISGVPLIDTLTAGELVRLGQALRLLSARGADRLPARHGASPGWVVGIELGSIKTYAMLQDALARIVS